METKIKDRGIFFKIDSNTDLDLLFDHFLSFFNFKIHRYIHILYINSLKKQDLLNLISKIKQKSVFIIFEPSCVDNVDSLKQLYAHGIDLFIFNNYISKNTKLLKEIMSVLPSDTIVLKNNEENILKNKGILKKMPFLLEDSLFEPIKRKIWIDITNLRRKLRIKEVYDSYNASGL